MKLFDKLFPKKLLPVIIPEGIQKVERSILTDEETKIYDNRKAEILKAVATNQPINKPMTDEEKKAQHGKRIEQLIEAIKTRPHTLHINWGPDGFQKDTAENE